MLTAEENELLCRVEGDAPMGQMMRRHWTPVGLAEDVSEPDGTPVHARAFGEDLFRAGEAAIGTGAEATRREVCSYQSIIPKEIDWRTFDARPVWGDVEAAVALDTNYQVQT